MDCVHLMTATVSELCTLPGIGEYKARILINFRDQFGLSRGMLPLITHIDESRWNRWESEGRISLDKTPLSNHELSNQAGHSSSVSKEDIQPPSSDAGVQQDDESILCASQGEGLYGLSGPSLMDRLHPPRVSAIGHGRPETSSVSPKTHEPQATSSKLPESSSLPAPQSTLFQEEQDTAVKMAEDMVSYFTANLDEKWKELQMLNKSITTDYLKGQEGYSEQRQNADRQIRASIRLLSEQQEFWIHKLRSLTIDQQPSDHSGPMRDPMWTMTPSPDTYIETMYQQHVSNVPDKNNPPISQSMSLKSHVMSKSENVGCGDSLFPGLMMIWILHYSCDIKLSAFPLKKDHL